MMMMAMMSTRDDDDDDGYLCFCLSNIIHTPTSKKKRPGGRWKTKMKKDKKKAEL